MTSTIATMMIAKIIHHRINKIGSMYLSIIVLYIGIGPDHVQVPSQL